MSAAAVATWAFVLLATCAAWNVLSCWRSPLRRYPGPFLASAFCFLGLSCIYLHFPCVTLRRRAALRLRFAPCVASLYRHSLRFPPFRTDYSEQKLRNPGRFSRGLNKSDQISRLQDGPTYGASTTPCEVTYTSSTCARTKGTAPWSGRDPTSWTWTSPPSSRPSTRPTAASARPTSTRRPPRSSTAASPTTSSACATRPSTRARSGPSRSTTPWPARSRCSPTSTIPFVCCAAAWTSVTWGLMGSVRGLTLANG